MTAASLLDQTEVWVNADGVHRIDEMDPNHRANLIPFLRGNARTFQRMAEAAYWGSALAIAADHDDVKADIEASFDTDPEQWLEQTPLMRRLVELEQGRSLASRAGTAMRNKAYEVATGYQKVRLG